MVGIILLSLAMGIMNTTVTRVGEQSGNRSHPGEQ